MDAEGRFWIAALTVGALLLAVGIVAATVGGLAGIKRDQEMGTICLQSGGSWVVLSGGSYGCLYGSRK